MPPQPQQGSRSDPEQWLLSTPYWHDIDAEAHPVIAAINRLSEPAAEALGPLLWAMLILLFVWAEISNG